MSQNANKNHPGSELEEIPIKYKAYKTKVIGRLNHDFWIYNQGLDNYKQYLINKINNEHDPVCYRELAKIEDHVVNIDMYRKLQIIVKFPNLFRIIQLASTNQKWLVITK